MGSQPRPVEFIRAAITSLEPSIGSNHSLIGAQMSADSTFLEFPIQPRIAQITQISIRVICAIRG